MYYITSEQAKSIHKITVEVSGGGITDVIHFGQLESVLQNIQNDEYYPTFIDKLTHLFYCTCQFHCFADGNKRLALSLSTQFLLLNGYLKIASRFIVDMRGGKLSTVTSHIRNVALGKLRAKSAYGFKWEFVEKSNDYPDKE